MRRVTCVSFSPVLRDGRVLRQAGALAADHDVTVVGYGGEPEVGRAHETPWRLAPLDRPRRGTALDRWVKGALLALGRLVPAWAYPRWYWRYALHRQALDRVVASRPDAIVANDWQALPLALEVARCTKVGVLLDLHEYAPRQWEDQPVWRALRRPAIDWFLRDGLGRVAAVTTTSAGYAAAYEREYGIRPTLVMNAPRRVPLPPLRPTDGTSIRMVHHGVASSARCLERSIEAVALAGDRFTLDLMLVPSNEPRVLPELEALATARAPGRVRFRPPVAPDEIVGAICGYDVGLFLLPPSTFDYAYTMPNKLYEFVAAGLAVCIGPSPEMARFVREYDCGAVADGFEAEDMARLLTSLRPVAVDRWKRHARSVGERVNADTEAAKLVAEIEAVLP